MPAGEWKGQSCLVCHRYLSACTCKPSALDVVDAASYRAGLEAAAKLFEDQAKLSTDAAWSEQLCEMAGEIRALPTPSTLPQEGKP